VGLSSAYPKSARLRRRRQYLETQGRGKRRHTAHFVVIRCPGPGPGARLGVTASTRVGNAVARNRVKRLVREIFRHRRGELAGSPDVVIIAKPGAALLTYAQAVSEIERALDIAAAT